MAIGTFKSSEVGSSPKIQPGHGTAGRHPTREFLDSLSGNDDPGMFGRMFPDLPPAGGSDAVLTELAAAMDDKNGAASGDNPNIPAGFTYLGQFVDHDITLDLTSIKEKQEDPLATENFRTPALDLDSVYGLGPDGSRQLYARKGPNDSGKNPGPKLLIGRADESPDLTTNPRVNIPTIPNDLARNPHGFALIGDHRNDENLIVAQTHLAMLKFHNKMCDSIGGGKSDDEVFKAARQTVTWHYQWMVLHDFVERLTEPGIVDKILHEGRRFYRFKKWPYMPVEFSAAAYRLGHSMVREVYDYNHIFRPPNPVPATLDLLFDFTGLSGRLVGELAPKPPTPPLPAERLPSNWAIDWRRFYDFAPAANPADVPINHTRKLDPFVVTRLHNLPGNGGSLPFRNLRRGVMLGLPSGQDVAAAMRIKNPLTPDEIATGDDGIVAKKHGLHTNTPLWYYILKEAEVRKNGLSLGPVGSTIVSEVFVGLVHGDHQSYLWQRGKNWKPELPSQDKGTFKMSDLLRFVGDISPIDGISTL